MAGVRFEVFRVQSQGPVWELDVAWSIPVAADHVFRVLTDFAGMRRWMRSLTRVQVLETRPTGARVRQEGRFLAVPVVTVLDVDWSRTGQIRFTQVAGVFRSFAGSWRWQALGPHHTRLAYHLRAEHPYGRRGSFLRAPIIRRIRQELEALDAWLRQTGTGPGSLDHG